MKLIFATHICSPFTELFISLMFWLLLFYMPIERRDILWNRPVRMSVHPSVCLSTIACECDILKTSCMIDFCFGLTTTETLDAIDLGHSTKSKMATTAV